MMMGNLFYFQPVGSFRKKVFSFLSFYLLITVFSSSVFGQVCTKVNLPVNLQSGLVAYYPFCGNANDISGNNNVLQATGVSLTTDRYGTSSSAYSFSNTQTNVTSYLKAVDPTPFAKNAYTISAWFNSNSFYPNIGGVTYNYQSIVGYAPQYYTWGPAYNIQLLHANNTILAATQWTAANPSQDIRTNNGAITTNQWYHVVLTYDGSTLKMYKDGTLVGTTPATIDYAHQIQFLIGANGDGPSPGGLYGGFNGKLDDIGFWDRPLDVCEVAQLYNLTAANPTPAIPYITGLTSGSSWRLLSSSTHTFSSAWSETLATANDPTKSYKLVVTGTWGIANGALHRDAAFDGINSSPVINQGCDANWNFDNVCHPPMPNTSFSYNSNHTYEYVFQGQSGGHIIAFTDGSYGDNNGSLTFTLYVNDGATDVCQGGSTTLTSSIAANNQWYKDGVAINSNGTNQTLSITQPGNYTVKQITGSGCISLSSNSIIANTISAPSYNALQDTIKVCGKQTTIDAGSGYTSYTWSTGQTTNTITATSTNKYKVTVVDNSGCTASDSTYVSLVFADILNNDTTICVGGSIKLSIDSSLISYNKWQTRLAGKEFYNIKKDGLGNLYALPSLNSNKIYKSVDRGETWVQQSGFPALGGYNYMALGVDAANNVYASTNDNGMYKSTNGGTTWTNVQDFFFGCGPMDIVFTTATGSVLTVKGSSRGIWYSGNSNSWTQKIGGLDPASVTKDIYGNLYASGFYKSVDNGLNWTALSNSYDGFVVRGDSLGNVYTINSSASSALYKSSNQGSTFSSVHPLNFTMTNSAYASDILFTNNSMFVAKGQIFYSKDGGYHFSQVDTIKYPTANPSGYYSNPTFRMEMLGNRLFVATTDGIKFIDINDKPASVRWSTGDTTNSIVVTPNANTKYTVTIDNGINSCQDSVMVRLSVFTSNFNPLQDTTTFCGQKAAILNAGTGYTSYTWNTGGNTQTKTVDLIGKQKITVANQDGCQSVDSTFVSLLGVDIINQDTIICRGDSVVLRSTSFSVGQNLDPQVEPFNTLSAFQTNGQGTTSITNDGINGGALTIVRPGLVRSIKNDYSYGTYEIDAKAGDAISNQGLLLLAQSTDINNPNPLITVDSRTMGTDDVGWALWYNGVRVATASGTNPASYPNWYRIKLRYTPDSLRLWINNTLLYDAVNPTLLSNPRGPVVINSYTLSKYDNFVYTPFVINKSIRWSTGDTTDNTIVKPTQTTTYTVTVSNGYTSCQKQVVVSVDANPVITANGLTTFCQGGTLTLTSSSNSNQWYRNGQLVNGAGSGNQIGVTTAGTYQALSTINNCSNSISNNIVVSVNPLPQISIVSSPVSATVCKGSPVVLTGRGAQTYSWNKGVVQAVAFAPSATDTYTVRGTDLNGCVNSASVQVLVNELPVAGLPTITQNSALIDKQISLTGNTQSGKPPYTYFWKASDSTRAIFTGQRDALVKGLSKGPIGIFYYVVDDNNCVSAQSGEVSLNILDTKLFFVPSAFSPNNDGLNDYLNMIVKPEVINLHYFKVFNRYGVLVYETQNLRWGWDGRVNGILQESDSFYWIAEYQIFGGEVIKESGQTALIK
ncbi:MAG: hypothetical protein RL377_799 [Bacteroidota bacterium]|jgi:gliding motility-associated-like protein